MKTSGKLLTEIEHPCMVCGAMSFSYHPNCHHDGMEYNWVCSHCGSLIKLMFDNGGLSCEQDVKDNRCETTLVLLQMREHPELCFIVEGCCWSTHTKDEQTHYYEQSTCPTNLLRCDEILYNGIPDKHGIFNMLAETPLTGKDAKDGKIIRAEYMDMALKIAEREQGREEYRT